MAKEVCNSCKTDISIVKNSNRFMCPACAKGQINRCGKCKHISADYHCSECGFNGP